MNHSTPQMRDAVAVRAQLMTGDRSVLIMAPDRILIGLGGRSGRGYRVLTTEEMQAALDRNRSRGPG